MPPVIPPVIAWTLSVLGAAALAKLLVREWRRIEAELHNHPKRSTAEPERAQLPKLRRDPVTGIYPPE